MSRLHRAGVGGLILGATLAIGAPARGDESHDQAQQVLTQANADLNAAQQRADTAQQLDDAVKARSADITAKIEDEQNAAKNLRDRLSRAESAVPEIQAKIDSAAARVTARKQEMVVADLKYGPLKYADDEVRLDAIHNFETSPERRASLAAVEDQAANVGAVEEKSLGGFAASPDYSQALSAMQSADAAVNAARQKGPADSSELTSAMKLAADAHAAVDALREKRLAADPNVSIARARLAETKKGVDELRRRFMDEQLPQFAKVKLADDALHAEQGNYDALAAAAKAAEADGIAAAQMMDRQKAGLAADHATLDRMGTEIAQLQTQNANVHADVDRADKALRVAVAYLDSSEQSRANAQAAVDALDAPASGNAVLPYYGNYSSGSVMYIQSSPIYASRPYYGSIFFAPPPSYGYSPIRGGFQIHGSFSGHGGHFNGNAGGGHRR